jgi:hypothetical protein
MLGVILLGLLTQSPPPLVSAADPGPRNFSRVGFAGMLGVGVNPVKDTTSLHGRAGFRFGLFDRTYSGSGANVAIAVLAGAGSSRAGGTTLGFDLRLELLYVGNKVEALEPIGNLFFTTGLVISTEGKAPIGYHVGAGLGFDLMFSGALGSAGGGLWRSVGTGGEAGIFIAAAILLVTSPTVEGRYTMRADGSGFGSVLIGVGI